MFDIGFSEIIVISVIALVVVGPERLPTMVRTVFMYIKKIKAGFNAVRHEVERELDLENLRKEFNSDELNTDKLFGYDEFEDTIKSVKKDIGDELEEIYEYADDPLDTKHTSTKQQDVFANKDPDEHADTGVEEIPPKQT